MKILNALLLVFGSALTHGWSQSVLTHPTQFQGPTILIDFETLPNGQSLPDYGYPGLSNQWASLDVLIRDSSPENGAARYRSVGEEIPTHSGTNGIGAGPSTWAGFVEFTFVNSVSLSPAIVQQVGMWIINGRAFPIGGASTATFYDIAGNVIYASDPIPYYDNFIGVRYDAGIASVRVSDPDYFLVDDLQFGPITPVPEPATWLMLISGGSVLLLMRRRALAQRSR